MPAPAPQPESTRGAYGMPTGGFTTDLATELRNTHLDDPPAYSAPDQGGGMGVPRGGFTTDLATLLSGKSSSTTAETAPPPQGYVGTPAAGGKVAVSPNGTVVSPAPANGKPQQVANAVPAGQQPAPQPQVQQPPAPPAEPSYTSAYGVPSGGTSGDLFHAIFGSSRN